MMGCNGTETQNPVNSGNGPLIAFGNSGCKKEILSASSKEVSTFSQIDAGSPNFGDEVAGLKCVAWEFTGTGRLKVNLINFEEACGAKWQGDAQVEATGQLHLNLVNPQCMVAACGWCIYDWSFEVKGLPGGQTLPTTITIDTCPGRQDIKTSSVELPLGTEPSGIKCRYANFYAIDWQAASLNTRGTVGMPCDGTATSQGADASATGTCQGDLVCTDNDAAQEICAKSCNADVDCGTSGAT